jgi:hypothetical protein
LEAEQVSAQISQEIWMSERACEATYDNQISLLLAERSRKEYKFQTLLYYATEGRYRIGALTLMAPMAFWIFENLWSFGAWAHGWNALAIGLVALAVMQVVVMALHARHRSLMDLPFPTVLSPPRNPTEVELRLKAQLELIDAELGCHRQVVCRSSRNE